MKKLVVCLLTATISVTSVNALNAIKSSYSIIKEVPEKTICIKNAQAADAANYFSSNTQFYFEVFKPGSKVDLTAIIEKLNHTDGIQSCTPGTVTGDYYGVTLTLKSKKDKAWFTKVCKEAGLDHIKINSNDAIAIEKL